MFHDRYGGSGKFYPVARVFVHLSRPRAINPGADLVSAPDTYFFLTGALKTHQINMYPLRIHMDF